MLGVQAYRGDCAGTSGVRCGSHVMAGVHSPMAKMYQDDRDYWALASTGPLGHIGSSSDLHPVGLLDFILGYSPLFFCKYTRIIGLTEVDCGLPV